MKLEAKFWGLPLVLWIVAGIFIWLILSGLGRLPRRRHAADDILDAFGVSDAPGSPAPGKVTQ